MSQDEVADVVLLEDPRKYYGRPGGRSGNFFHFLTPRPGGSEQKWPREGGQAGFFGPAGSSLRLVCLILSETSMARWRSG